MFELPPLAPLLVETGEVLRPPESHSQQWTTKWGENNESSHHRSFRLCLPPLVPLLVEAEKVLDPQKLTVSNGQPNRDNTVGSEFHVLLPPLVPLLVEAEKVLDPQNLTVSNGQPNREKTTKQQICRVDCDHCCVIVAHVGNISERQKTSAYWRRF